jgi:hypothetical protein
MPALTLARWAEFESDFGPLTVHERIDAAAASIAYTVHASSGGKLPPEQFITRWKKPKRWTDDQLWMWLGAEAKKAKQ